MDRIAVDTTFLIDLQNARRARVQSRGAEAFLRANQRAEFFLPVVARGEYLEGFDDPDSRDARVLIDSMKILNVTCEVARNYASVARNLRSAGRMIGANDLWIGCTAKTANFPLVTRNTEEFERITGLAVLNYAVGRRIATRSRQ